MPKAKNNSAGLPIGVDDIYAAAETIKGRVVRTPAIVSDKISEISGAHVVLKLENMQHTGSFKPRGALTKLLSLKSEGDISGVIAASAGNHAQGVAYHARALGLPATIVMPVGTPFTKVARTEALGAKTVLYGEG
ncbi:MAG: pyridoxal-phosphate dependent enzyme, partial [Rhodospirillaceae bacterium]|nr:pyridoxal-phosphate dependent enzyme [Rhodospirillaceae bacterium]